MPTTPNLGLRYPALTDTADVPRDIGNLAADLDNGAVPVGAMMMWLTGTPPAGWLLCQGQSNIAIATYPKLAALLGNTGGFINMPDMRDRFPGGAGTDNGAVNAGVGGDSIEKLASGQCAVPSHTHTDGTLTVAAHTHSDGTLAVAGHTHDQGTLAIGSHSHTADGTLAAASHGHSYGGGTARVPTNTIGFTRINMQHGSGAFNNNVVGYSGAGTDANDLASDSVAPDVTGSTSSVAPTIAGASGSAAPDVTGATGSTTPDVTGDTGAYTLATAVSDHDNRPLFRAVNFIIRAL